MSGMCTSGTVDKIFVIGFIFLPLYLPTFLINVMCTSGTVDILSIIVFVSINIVSTRGKCDVYLGTVGIQYDKGFI